MSTTGEASPANDAGSLQERLATLGEFRAGFPVVATATIGSAFGISTLGVYAIPYFMPSFESEFGWTRSAVGVASSCITGGVFLAAPLVGRLCDRLGVRRVVMTSILLFAIQCVLLTQVRAPIWTLYLGYFLLAIPGAGLGYISYSRAVNTWFDKNRGLALGLMTAGTGIGAALVPLLVPKAIDAYGWRGGFVALGLAALLALPFVALFLHERADHTRSHAIAAAGLTLAQALRTRRFWSLAAGGMLLATAISGAVLHLVPMFVDLGAPRIEAQRAAAMYGVSMIFARVLIGVLLDRMSGPLIAFVVFIAPACTFALTGTFGAGFAMFYAIAIGIALGAETDLLAFLCSRYFGMRAFSELYGWLFSATALGFVAGPLLAGAAYSTWGNYEIARWIWASLCVVAAVLFGTLGRYPQHELGVTNAA